jgi:hypothetical protein
VRHQIAGWIDQERRNRKQKEAEKMYKRDQNISSSMV